MWFTVVAPFYPNKSWYVTHGRIPRQHFEPVIHGGNVRVYNKHSKVMDWKYGPKFYKGQDTTVLSLWHWLLRHKPVFRMLSRQWDFFNMCLGVTQLMSVPPACFANTRPDVDTTRLPQKTKFFYKGYSDSSLQLDMRILLCHSYPLEFNTTALPASESLIMHQTTVATLKATPHLCDEWRVPLHSARAWEQNVAGFFTKDQTSTCAT